MWYEDHISNKNFTQKNSLSQTGNNLWKLKIVIMSTLSSLVIITTTPCPGNDDRYWNGKCHHFDEIFVTDCSESCQNDNFQCSQWWKFRQNGNISVSVELVLWQLLAFRDAVSWSVTHATFTSQHCLFLLLHVLLPKLQLGNCFHPLDY